MPPVVTLSQMFFCSNSDDNMLKNIELFDKLSLRFNGRVLFIKDVIGDEICCWSFYGQGRKIAEVCCTSIVYATEKKQTKVRAARGQCCTAALTFALVQLPFALEQKKLKERKAFKVFSLTHDCSLFTIGMIFRALVRSKCRFWRLGMAFPF